MGNSKNPNSLACIASLEPEEPRKHQIIGPLNGPGIDPMLKAFADADSRDKYKISIQRKARSRYQNHRDTNPIGDVVAAEARYATAPIPGSEKHMALCDTIGTAASLPAPATDGGIFFQTELDFDEVQDTSSSTPMQRSSSVPVLPRLNATSRSGGEDFQSSNSTALQMKPMLNQSQSQQQLRHLPEAETEAQQQPPKEKKGKLVRAFQRAVAGKSLLVLTDRPDVRKSIMRTMLAAGATICFVKSTNDLWSRFRNQKEQYDGMLLDLSKKELRPEPLLQTIRSHDRYGKLPIVVLSEHRELPDIVRSSCSFVVFMPLAASMLREALLWCYHRPAVQSRFLQEDGEKMEMLNTYGTTIGAATTATSMAAPMKTADASDACFTQNVVLC